MFRNLINDFYSGVLREAKRHDGRCLQELIDREPIARPDDLGHTHRSMRHLQSVCARGMRRGRESVHDNNNRGFLYFTCLLKYQRTYGVSVTDNSCTMDGWTPAAWAMASIQSCSWIMSGWRLIMILPVSVMKYVQIYPLLHRQ